MSPQIILYARVTVVIRGIIDVMQISFITLYSGTTSIVTYTPITELDYGTLLCLASNKIGKQRVPCVFHIIAAGACCQILRSKLFYYCL